MFWLDPLLCKTRDSHYKDHLVDLMVKVLALRAADLGLDSCLDWDFSGLSHASDLRICTPMTTLPGAWCCRVSAGIDLPSVSIP